MKIQRTPIILFAIAALLGGVVYLRETGAARREEAQQQTKKLFPFREADVQAFTLQTLLKTLSFTKSATQPTASPAPKSASIWQMTVPKTVPANEGSIAYLLNLVGTGTSEKTITAPASRRAEFGLEQPLATVDVTLNDQKRHRLVLGKPDFNRTYLYAQVDPPEKPEANITVHLVSLDFENAVTRQLPEWEAPAKSAQSTNSTDKKPSTSTPRSN